jgi:hypothetical protein
MGVVGCDYTVGSPFIQFESSKSAKSQHSPRFAFTMSQQFVAKIEASPEGLGEAEVT